MQQSMAEVKVETVDTLSKSNDLEMERDACREQAQQSAASLQEVRSPRNMLLLFFCFKKLSRF